MTITDSSPTPVFPPDLTVTAAHFVGQDSPYKGLRIVEMTWLPARGFWQWDQFFYGPKELGINGWIYLDEAPASAPAPR